MERCLSFLASLVDPESNRRYVNTWSPDTLRRVSLFCPWVVYSRIEYRIRDLERGGDGFGIPYCCCNGRCFCGCFQFCCCCCCCCGYSEILVLQRDMARIWGHPRPESDSDCRSAGRRPWRFLADTESGLHAACVARNRLRHPLTSPYRTEPPMQLPAPGPRRSKGPSLIIPPGDGSPAASPFSPPTSSYELPIALGPPSGPLAVMPPVYPELYDIEECELDGVYGRTESRRVSVSLGGGDAAGDLGVLRRGSRRGSWGWDAGSRGRYPVEGNWPRRDSSRRRTSGNYHGTPRQEDTPHDRTTAGPDQRAPSGQVPSRIVIEGSESNVVADSGNVDGAGGEGGSIRVRSVRVRMDVSRESLVEPEGSEDEKEKMDA